MSQDMIPAEVSKVGLDSWYSELNDPTKVKVRRYLQGIDTSSSKDFLIQLMSRSYEDDNYKLSASIGEFAMSQDMDDISRFDVTNAYIDGLYGAEMFDKAKEMCCLNLDLFPKIRDSYLAENGNVLPKNIPCRNRLIDILVGVEYDYETADEALDGFLDIGIMNADELSFRKQSLKIHRLQKSFDNLFIYRPKE